MLDESGTMGFISEMSERQISAREFFSNVLLDSLSRNFGWKNVLILCFDTEKKFLSWTDKNGILIDSENHPYHDFADKDVIGHIIYEDAVRDKLTYFNTEPRLYKSSEVIGPVDYDSCSYVRFLEENFGAHYSVTMAFGINAYIHIMFYKTREEGDFTDEEMSQLRMIYVFVANAYKNFKKHEQTKIIANIQNEIITSGENAYLITDDFMHVMSYNQTALHYLTDLLGDTVEQQIAGTEPCLWLPFLLGDTSHADHVQTRVIKDYVFKVYTYEQSYQHGIVDVYHWITISHEDKKRAVETEKAAEKNVKLTRTEKKVADLLCSGLTYQAIADEMVISYHTVKNHVQNIFSKYGIKNRYQLYKIYKPE